MKKVFIDTNIWLRYFTADDKNKFEACKKLIGLNEEGKIRIYTSTIVLLELAYTLKTYYKTGQKQIVGDIKTILLGRNLTLIEKTNFLVAIDIFQKYNLRLADSLIAIQIPKGTILCTYDRDFKRVKNLVSLTPEEIVDRIQTNENK